MKQIFAPVLGLAVACNSVASPGLAEDRVSIGPEDKGQVRILACPMNGSVELWTFRVDERGKPVGVIDDFGGTAQVHVDPERMYLAIVSWAGMWALHGKVLSFADGDGIDSVECTDVTERLFSIFGY